MHRARPDVTSYINGVRVILEGSSSQSDAENDISERIKRGIGDIGIALFYKEAFPQSLTDFELEEKFKNSTFEVRLIVSEDITGTMVMYLEGRQKVPKWITGWMEANFRDLISIINEALQFIFGEEDVKQSLNKIEENIQDFARSVKSLDHNLSIAKNLYDLFYRLYGLSVGNYKEIAELIYAKAALILLLSATLYQSVHATHNLPSLDELRREHGP